MVLDSGQNTDNHLAVLPTYRHNHWEIRRQSGFLTAIGQYDSREYSC